MLRSLTMLTAGVASIAAGAPLSATSIVSRSLTPDADGGFVCADEHVSRLGEDRLIIVADPRDERARALRRHFDSRELTVVGAGNARGTGFDVTYLLDPDVAADADFVAGLQLAAQVWEATISDNVTIFVEVGFVSNQGFIGAASSNRITVDYADFRAAALADAGPLETLYVGALPDPLSLQTSSGVASSDDFNFDGIDVTTANARALGFPVDTSGNFSDASIVFNTDFDFDSDPSDGLTPDAIDTVYVMVHEIGHMLGFISSVDSFSSGDFATGLDVYRVGIAGAANDPATLPDFSTVPREVRRGVEAAIDPVASVVGAPKGEFFRFSTGSFGGDGRQASHWKDDVLLKIEPNIGVMDPTNQGLTGQGSGANPGYITFADRLAFSLIGWDIDFGIDPCAGDLDGDTIVGAGDLAVLLAAWGGAGVADLDASGSVGAGDLAILLATWGPCS